MTLSALGIFSAAGAGGVPFSSDYEFIESYILGSNQASVTFSNLGTYSSTYKHLQIRYAARTISGSTLEELRVQFNANTGTNYSRHELAGTDSQVKSAGEASITGAQAGFLAQNASSNVFSGGVVDILDPYSTTKNTTVRALSGFHFGTGFQSMIALTGGAFFNTASITEMKFYGSINNLAAGSRFSLYGIKG
jgi:hypothetical protein